MSRQFIEEDKNKTRLTLRALVVKLWPHMIVHRGWMLGILAAVIFYAGLGRALPFLFGYAIDHGIKEHDFKVLYISAAIFFIFEVLRSFLEFGQTYAMERLGNRVLYELREKLMSHVEHLPIIYFDKNPTGRIVNRVTNDVYSLGDLFNQGFTAIFVNTLELLTIVIAMFLLSPLLAAVTLFVVPLAVFIALKISESLRVHFSEAKKIMAAVSAFTTESLGGMKVLQLFDRTRHRRDNFELLTKGHRQAQIETVKRMSALWPVLSFFNIATIASSLYFGGLFYDRLGLSVGALSTFVLLVQSFYAPLRIIIERYNQFQNSLAGADRIFTLLGEPQEKYDGITLGASRFRGEIQFKNLNFRYSESTPMVLKNINLHIRRGESVALVGRTGSGKSTITSLLQKFYPITKGELEIDGTSIGELSTQYLRRKMAIVQQDNFIFRGSIADNVSLGDSHISESKILAALRNAGAWELVEKMGGISALVDERGQNLSVGEKQLLAFARILAFDPDILILDEATANIDSHSEAIIQKATTAVTQGRTSIIVAHRLSTVVNCNRIVVLEDGEIIEQGSHSELMAKSGKYFELYQKHIL